jgi:uncharacterized protein DUF3467
MAKEDEEKAQKDSGVPADSDIPASLIGSSIDQHRIRRDDFFSYYTNSITANISVWDVTLVLGEVSGDKDGKAVIEERVKILMSRELAKVFNKILTDQIAAYEKKYGVIKIPDIAK